jgi:nucleotidyltransferase substrate binding protein (TIGR01987 family)
VRRLMPLDLTSLRKAIVSLRGVCALIDDAPWYAAQSPALRDGLMAGAIQNFEFVFELSVKTIRRQIELSSEEPQTLRTMDFRDQVRVAAEMGIIDNPVVWFEYRRLRNMTSHTYDRSKAEEMYTSIPRLLHDAEALLATLEQRS